VIALFVVVAGVGSLIYAAWYTSEPVRIRRMLRDAQTYPIADLQDGQAGRIVGRAQVYRERIVAPLSGRRCLYYVVAIEQSKYGTDVWSALGREERSVAFFVEDATERAIVDANHARVALEFDHETISRSVEELDDAQRALLARQRINPLHRTLRYMEAILDAGEIVSVLGAGTREPDPDRPPESAYRGNQPTRLRLTSSRRHPLVISDDPDTTS
jgi:hypothetical protein